ncbi:Protein MAIN-LIKE 1 [Glycine max]|nr:Protein MAIN-LIKE 1 [Glycine max]
MVRTRGLDRTLGKIIGRALGRERQKPIASARRQWEAVHVAEDVQHVDHPTDEPKETGVDDVVTNAESFSGEPHDTSVLIGYVHHVVVTFWSEEEHPELKLSYHRGKVEKFGSPLITCSLDTNDRGLISTFVERWHKETSSFHLPVGEVTITLDNVASLLHLPITSTFHSFKALHMDEVMLLLVELLEVSSEKAKAETIQCHGTYVWLSWLRDIYRYKCDAAQWTVAAQAYLLHLSVTHVHVVFLDAFRDLTQSGSYAWGTVALRQTTCRIYHTFIDYHERKPRVCRWKSGKAFLVLTYRKWLD